MCEKINFYVILLLVVVSAIMGKSLKSQKEKYDDNLPNCGKVRRRFTRIAGGRESHLGDHPWQAFLLTRKSGDKPTCGGSLLTDKWVITAAHCVVDEPIKTLTVRLGELNFQNTVEELKHKDYKVEKKKIHPKYVAAKHRRDIALLKLNETVKFEEHISPICLPSKALLLIGRTATVTGWGFTRNGDSSSSPAVLNQVDIKVLSNKLCKRWFRAVGFKDSLDKSDLCAGDGKGGRDSCEGDSGGPLSIVVDGRRVLIGIVTWGYGCARKHSPGVYANVQKSLPWIKGTIG